jgi:hypothetical protein
MKCHLMETRSSQRPAQMAPDSLLKRGSGESTTAQEKTQPHNKDQAGGETRTEKEERKEENRQEKKEDHQTGAGRHRGTDKHGTE